jgi:hypothetical protein
MFTGHTTSLMSAARHKLAVVAVAALTVVAVVGVAVPSAGAYSWGGRELHGKEWTSDGVFDAGLYYERVEPNTTSSTCVGPVQKSGGGYVFPYGWKCTTSNPTWEHTALTAAAGFYNPNSGTVSSWSGLAYY